MKHTIRMVLLFLFIFPLNIQVYAHPGRTDLDGGHNDNINGGYHYHHGCPEHDHSGGKCHYSEKNNNSSSSGSSEDDQVFIYVGYAFLALIIVGIFNRIRVDIKVKRKDKKLTYKKKTSQKNLDKR